LLVGIAAAIGELDIQVLTEATKSLRYRGEYWVGAWRVITQIPGAWWHGLGPGNFAGPYLRYKLPQASEAIVDPHNMILDVWATAGLGAVVALLAALGFGLRDVLGSGRSEAEADAEIPSEPPRPSRQDPTAPPSRPGWLVLSEGGAWLMVAMLGMLNPFEGRLLARWVVLGVAWAWAIVLGLRLWRRQPIPAVGLGAGALAIAVNLLAAGGIGIAPVALALWAWLALGQNLREDRPCGRWRGLGGRWAAFALAAVWAMLLGSFWGAIGPYWQAQAAMTEAEEALRRPRPDFAIAEESFYRAARADVLGARPWIELAGTDFQSWLARGAPLGDRVWVRVEGALKEATTPPRNPQAPIVPRLRAAMLRQILELRGDKLPEADVRQLRRSWVEALARAVVLHPTDAPLRAELATALAATDRSQEAARQAREALRLDALTPHADKRLPAKVRQRLSEELPRWEQNRPSERMEPRPPSSSPGR
ncbi:MAG: O-antigen ligase domain-containing protein, partial [Isosphaeraceae bacterium]|nr:O-antigen ligase domain-containing protein [Isosphaeraceae bacterium]